MRKFDIWLNTFRQSIADYHYYTDFANVYRNANQYKAELHLLNSLVGSRDIENEFITIIDKFPTCLKAIPILLAKREEEIFCMDKKGAFTYNFSKMNLSINQYVYFMKETGLFNLISSHIISNLYDYVLGVNTGLDSNGRKNRGGYLMEDLCENYIKEISLPYGKQVDIQTIEKQLELNLASLSNNGEVTKRFDFVIYGKMSTYAIECNFYASGGSKLNETARSYKNIALEAKNIPGFTFIWLTDGKGWKNARNNLKETFDILPTLYNISELENGILKTLE